MSLRKGKLCAFLPLKLFKITYWDSIRENDRGLLWEHLVVDTLRTSIHESKIYYWRDKSGREIDFIIKEQEGIVHTLECKINPDQFDLKSLSAFRSLYPNGNNYIIRPNIKISYKRTHQNHIVQYCPLQDFNLVNVDN